MLLKSSLLFLLPLVGTAHLVLGFSTPMRSRDQTSLTELGAKVPVDGCHPRQCIQRRIFLEFFTAAMVVVPGSSVLWSLDPNNAYATEVRGPIELLRPATRVRLYIDHAVEICLSIRNGSSSDISSLDELARHFDSEPITFMTPEETRLSKQYLEIDTSSSWQAARLKDRETRGAELGIDYTTPYDRLNTVIQQWGDKRQFQILRTRQRQLEQSDSIRAALNAYTNNLVFGDAYQLNVQGDAKKNLVRQNALPDVNSVVVSDLDLRDLYRNEILQNMENAKAELKYQLQTGETDIGEVLGYLQHAQTACEQWFGFIPSSDVETAFQNVLQEQRNNSSRH